MTPAADVSQYQGTIDWASMPPIALIKMSGGDDGLYMDSDAATNYNNAKANNKAVGGYHFIGWTIGAVAEANYFMQAMSPLAENDVYALDIESIPSGTDVVSYVSTMVNTIHSKIVVWPLVYMSLSTLNSYDWSSVLTNCGLWLADWNNDPNATLPTVHTYVMQQYNDGPIYDHDEFFGTVDQFNAYGYHAPVSPPSTPAPVSPTPAPPITSPSAPVTPTTPTPTTPLPGLVNNVPTPTPDPGTVIKPTPDEPDEDDEDLSWWQRLINWIKEW